MDAEHPAEPLSEEQIIALIGEALPVHGDEILVGPGDDAAVIRDPGGQSIVVTSDMLVEGVHFDLRYMSLADVGWKALAVNLSDIAAMGAEPQYAVGNLGVPRGASREKIADLLSGVAACAREYDVKLIGGDTTRSPQWTIAFTVFGLGKGVPLTRSAAKVGDVIVHSGELGLSQLGLHLLWGGYRESNNATERHRRPRPDFTVNLLQSHSACNACIDLSDSLSKSVHLISRSSGVGVLLDFRDYPFNERLRQFARSLSIGDSREFEVPATLDPQGKTRRFTSLAEFLLASSEDYVMLCTGGEKLSMLVGAYAQHPHLNLYQIGQVVEASAGLAYIDEYGNKHELRQSGFEHF